MDYLDFPRVFETNKHKQSLYLVLGNLLANLFQITLGENQPHVSLNKPNSTFQL